jgi:DNA-binding response OmpR family regulator
MAQPKSQTILIVEDEAALLQTLAETFKAAGFTVLQARDGKEGLGVALVNHPALILLDIVMPVMDGMAMLERLREDRWGKEVPVILLTNLSDPAKVSEALAGGAYDYLVKTDWKLDEVVERVRYRINHPNYGTPR